jgi:hypothetical protein
MSYAKECFKSVVLVKNLHESEVKTATSHIQKLTKNGHCWSSIDKLATKESRGGYFVGVNFETPDEAADIVNKISKRMKQAFGPEIVTKIRYDIETALIADKKIKKEMEFGVKINFNRETYSVYTVDDVHDMVTLFCDKGVYFYIVQDYHWKDKTSKSFFLNFDDFFMAKGVIDTLTNEMAYLNKENSMIADIFSVVPGQNIAMISYVVESFESGYISSPCTLDNLVDILSEDNMLVGDTVAAIRVITAAKEASIFELTEMVPTGNTEVLFEDIDASNGSPTSAGIEIQKATTRWPVIGTEEMREMSNGPIGGPLVGGEIKTTDVLDISKLTTAQLVDFLQSVNFPSAKIAELDVDGNLFSLMYECGDQEMRNEFFIDNLNFTQFIVKYRLMALMKKHST